MIGNETMIAIVRYLSYDQGPADRFMRQLDSNSWDATSSEIYVDGAE